MVERREGRGPDAPTVRFQGTSSLTLRDEGIEDGKRRSHPQQVGDKRESCPPLTGFSRQESPARARGHPRQRPPGTIAPGRSASRPPGPTTRRPVGGTATTRAPGPGGSGLSTGPRRKALRPWACRIGWMLTARTPTAMEQRQATHQSTRDEAEEEQARQSATQREEAQQTVR